jgi:hypothetical protein
VNVTMYLITCLAGGMIGIVLFVAGFKLFDYATPGWDFEKAFSGHVFTGGSLVVAAYLLGLAIIISRVAS